ncbi:spermidine/putrescine ABC transporter periplasmic spermidine/putrescine-binding protein [Caballeronia hypogeia]|uniref:Spermidine/putrescine ABC transporter periplasmic spermidine/putrescine-binding protein n=1 Tax=Caballeronia hypogeia TaxID=1777140 RepID=A0A158D0L8_9BURK|nr:ABC transporter substrate-binding protein [Caballeronia hypogeia]SAK87766.1 spermidine/putrescine ABC transporter periplasmic spermidine/putrescine-binding protein [Caballeronia hypogeia]
MKNAKSMSRHRVAIIAGLLLLPGFAFAQQSITVTSWGGAIAAAQQKAMQDPFTAKTGIKVIPEDYDGGLAEIQSQVKTGNVKWDVVNVEAFDALKGCDEGLFEKIGFSKLPPGDDGVPASKDFAKGLMSECGVPTDLYANVLAYDKAKFGANGPKTINDFFDLGKYPGKRALRKAPGVALEWALMADGVAPADLYKTLATPAGLDRAFKKLDTIKPQLVWWTAGAQPPQLLASGEVVMTSVYNGRIYDANVKDKRNFAIVWDGQVQIPEGWVVLKNGKKTAAALDFVRFATGTQPLAAQANIIPYAPPRTSALNNVTGATKSSLPNAGQSGRAVVSNAEFWSDNGDDINKRFSAWLAK